MDEEGFHPLSMLRQLQSNDPVYRKISTLDKTDLISRTRVTKFGEEIISSAWSQDGSLFAWAVGTNMVSIHAVDKLFPHTGSFDRKNGPSRFELEQQFANLMGTADAEAGRIAQIDCSHAVTSMAFGYRSSNKRRPSEVKYTRFDTQGLLVLAVGLATGDIKVFELSTGKLMLVLQDHSDAVLALQFAPDGSMQLCSSSKDYTVKLWDLMDDGNMFKTLIREERNKPFNYMAFSPDANSLLIVGDGKLALLFDMKTFTVKRSLKGHLNDVTACTFSDDGKYIYTSSFDTRVVCWDAETGDIVRRYEHMNPPPSNIFAAGTNEHEVIGMDVKGDRLATICADGNLRVWDLQDVTRKEPISVTVVVPEPTSIVFSSDGNILNVGCHGGIIQFFLVE